MSKVETVQVEDLDTYHASIYHMEGRIQTLSRLVRENTSEERKSMVASTKASRQAVIAALAAAGAAKPLIESIASISFSNPLATTINNKKVKVGDKEVTIADLKKEQQSLRYTVKMVDRFCGIQTLQSGVKPATEAQVNEAVSFAEAHSKQ